jgi:hypothetical protein
MKTSLGLSENIGGVLAYLLMSLPSFNFPLTAEPKIDAHLTPYFRNIGTTFLFITFISSGLIFIINLHSVITLNYVVTIRNFYLILITLEFLWNLMEFGGYLINKITG